MVAGSNRASKLSATESNSEQLRQPERAKSQRVRLIAPAGGRAVAGAILSPRSTRKARKRRSFRFLGRRRSRADGEQTGKSWARHGPVSAAGHQPLREALARELPHLQGWSTPAAA